MVEAVAYLIQKLERAQINVRLQIAKYAPEGQRRYVADYDGIEDWRSWIIDENLQDVKDYPLSPIGEDRMRFLGSCARIVMNGYVIHLCRFVLVLLVL